jgi:hypothetical protein
MNKAYLTRQIPLGISQTILEVVGKQNRRRLLPQLGLLRLDVFRHVCLALPVVHVVQSPSRELHRVRKSAPYKVLQRGDPGSGIGQGLPLSDFHDLGSRGPKVCQGKDNVRPGKDLLQSFVAEIEVCGLNIDSFCGESQGGRLGDIASEASNPILVGILEELIDNRASLFCTKLDNTLAATSGD